MISVDIWEVMTSRLAYLDRASKGSPKLVLRNRKNVGPSPYVRVRVCLQWFRFSAIFQLSKQKLIMLCFSPDVDRNLSTDVGMSSYFLCLNISNLRKCFNIRIMKKISQKNTMRYGQSIIKYGEPLFSV